jgi:hypothetical protein
MAVSDQLHVPASSSPGKELPNETSSKASPDVRYLNCSYVTIEMHFFLFLAELLFVKSSFSG